MLFKIFGSCSSSWKTKRRTLLQPTGTIGRPHTLQRMSSGISAKAWNGLHRCASRNQHQPRMQRPSPTWTRPGVPSPSPTTLIVFWRTWKSPKTLLCCTKDAKSHPGLKYNEDGARRKVSILWGGNHYPLETPSPLFGLRFLKFQPEIGKPWRVVTPPPPFKSRFWAKGGRGLREKVSLIGLMYEKYFLQEYVPEVSIQVMICVHIKLYFFFWLFCRDVRWPLQP